MEISILALRKEAAKQLIEEIYNDGCVDSIVERLPKMAPVGTIISLAMTEELCNAFGIPLPKTFEDRKTGNMQLMIEQFNADVEELMETLICERLRDEIKKERLSNRVRQVLGAKHED